MQPTDLEAELERHHHAAYGWALSCCSWHRHDAEDVLQASYLKVLAGSARFRGRSMFRTWLFGVIRRTAAEHRRRSAARRLVTLLHADGVADRADAEEQLERSESTGQLVRAMRTLPRRQREVLHLVFYENLSIRDAAVVMGVSLGTARTHYERGKRGLRLRLEPGS